MKFFGVKYFTKYTPYTLIMFLKVLSHFIMKIKNFMKYFKEEDLKYFKISMKFQKISCIPNYCLSQLVTHTFLLHSTKLLNMLNSYMAHRT